MSRSEFRKIYIRDILNQKNYYKIFLNNLNSIVCDYDYEEFCETLKLADIKKIINIRAKLADLFHQTFNTFFNVEKKNFKNLLSFF